MKSLILAFLVAILWPSIIHAQDVPVECDHDTVIEWIHQRETISQRFEEADTELSNNLTTITRIPRVDLLVTIQNIRREFEWVPYPKCAEELYHVTTWYWTQRIDALTIGLAKIERPNSLETTAEFYQGIVLPAIYRLEGAANIDFFAEAGKERPETAPDPTNIKLGEIITSNAALEKVIAVEPVTLPNCNGSSELVISREFTKSTERHVVLQGEGRLEASIGIAQAYVEAFGSLDDNQSMSESLEVEMRAAPGTTVTYQIEWIEVSTAGVLEVTEGDTLHFVEFSIPDMLRANVRQPVQSPCSVEAELDDNTLTTPTPDATQSS